LGRYQPWRSFVSPDRRQRLRSPQLGRPTNCATALFTSSRRDRSIPPHIGLFGSRGVVLGQAHGRDTENGWNRLPGPELSLTLTGVRAAAVSITGFIQILPFHVERSEEGQDSRARRHSCHHIHMRGIVTSNGICIVVSCAHSRRNGLHASLVKRLARAGKLRAHEQVVRYG
jgi:hypothetical protein